MLITRRVAAPADFLLDWNCFDGRAGGGLLAGAQYGFRAAASEMDFASDHADARALGPGVNRKRGAGYGNQCIAGIHKQMVFLFCRLDNHAAAIEVNSRAGETLADGKL